MSLLFSSPFARVRRALRHSIDRTFSWHGRRIATALLAVSVAQFAHAGDAAAQPAAFFQTRAVDSAGASNELIVRLRSSTFVQIGDTKATCGAESECERAVLSAANSLESSTLKQILGNPLGARHLILEGRPTESARDRLALNDPYGKLLSYLVVRYSTPAAAALAQERLRATPGVELAFVERNESKFSSAWQWSTPINDSSFQPAYVDQLRQWGMITMNFPGAWDHTPGGAYLGAVELGLPRTAQDAKAPFYFMNCNNGAYAVASWHCDLADNLRPHLDVGIAVQSTPSQNPRIYHNAHVVGIMAARGGNGQGTVGGCPWCSVLVGGVGDSQVWSSNANAWVWQSNGPIESAGAAALVGLINRGVQAVNVSANAWKSYTFKFVEIDGKTYRVPDVVTTSSCAWPDVFTPTTFNKEPFCNALQYAAQRGVSVVVSTGNFHNTRPYQAANNYLPEYDRPVPMFPAAEPEVIAVAASFQNKSLWNEQAIADRTNVDADYKEASSAPASAMGVMAPGWRIISTFPSSAEYSNLAWVQCGDTPGYDATGYGGDMFGTCTGTSMAAPHITALVGLLRSVNPLLTTSQVKQMIRSAGHLYPSTTDTMGAGVPNAETAVNAAIATNIARLTPLFSFYNDLRKDSFYTVVPQMGSAALAGTLLAEGGGPGYYQGYVPAGTGVPGIANFPGYAASAGQPLAQAWVFTTPTNPFTPGINYTPILRLSSTCTSRTPAPSACGANNQHWDFTYVTDTSEVTALLQAGYRIDGMEGFVYPKTSTPLSGMVRLLRKYNPTTDDNAIFPEVTAIVNDMTTRGYTANSGNSDWLGYVYPNTGSKPMLGSLNAQIVSETPLPMHVYAGGTYTISITVKNTGGATWSSADQIRLGSQSPQNNTNWGFSRVELPGIVAPNQNVTFTFNVNAPSTPGWYHSQWRMLRENIAWFGQSTYDDYLYVLPNE